MRKSINPMCCFFFFFSDRGEAFAGFAPEPVVLMSLQPVILWQVALLHCLPLSMNWKYAAVVGTGGVRFAWDRQDQLALDKVRT